MSEVLVSVDPIVGLDQTKRLAELETVIGRAVQTFVEIGFALQEIRDQQLYRGRYRTFERYCQNKWGWGASRSRQLIAGATVTRSLEGVTDVTPINEAQARAINRVPADKRSEVWDRAVSESKSRSIPITTAVTEVARARGDLPFERPTLYGKRLGKRGNDANQVLYNVAERLRKRYNQKLWMSV